MNAVALKTIQRRAEKSTSWLQRNSAVFTLTMTAALFVVMSFFPETALAQNLIDGKAGEAMAWIKRAVYFILTVAVIGSGVLAAFGRMSWATVGQVLIGAIVAGVATEVVDALYGG